MPPRHAHWAARPLPLFTLAATLALVGCSQAPAPAAATPEVSTFTATPETVTLTRQLVGRLSAYRTADVRARVPGVLQSRLYAEGTDVSADQPLFQIDPAPLQTALARAQAALQSARAAGLNARAAADRARSLAPAKFVSQADLDNAQAAERSANAAISEAEASVRAAQIDLGYARVRAPINGRAGKQQVTEGALVGSGEVTLLTTVDQIDPLYVNLSIGAADLEALREQQNQGQVSLSQTHDIRVRVIKANGRPYRHTATLDFAAMDVDPSSGAVSLRALLPNPERELLPGAFVSVEADLGNLAGAYRIPQQAVQRDKDGAFVMVVNGAGVVARKDVTLEPRAIDGHWVVTQGLAPNDRIIALGLQSVRAGEKVATVPYREPDQAPQGQGPGSGNAVPAAAAAQN